MCLHPLGTAQPLCAKDEKLDQSTAILELRFIFFVVCFLRQPHYATQADLESTILQPQPPEC
jgi:hypothetical protein